MSRSTPAIYTDGVFRPLKKIDLPPEPQTYFLVIIAKEDIEEMPSSISNPWNTMEKKMFDLLAELKKDLSELSSASFQFDEQHRQLFLENAQIISPLIPSIVTEENTMEAEN